MVLSILLTEYVLHNPFGIFYMILINLAMKQDISILDRKRPIVTKKVKAPCLLTIAITEDFFFYI